jgi:hypothetical protein
MRALLKKEKNANSVRIELRFELQQGDQNKKKTNESRQERNRYFGKILLELELNQGKANYLYFDT